MNSFLDRLRIAGGAAASGKSLRFVATAALCALGSVATAVADDIQLPITAGGAEPTAFEAEVENGIELSLDKVIVHALRHNVSLVVQRYARSQSLLGVQEALGIYDFNLQARLETNSNSRRANSLLEGADVVTSEGDTWNFTLSRLTQYGGTAQLIFNNSRTGTTDTNRTPNPQYSVFANLGISQPLLRGFGKEVTERSILVARNDTKINTENFRTEVESVVQQVSDVYWNLVGAKEQLKVAKESLKLAKELHEMNRIQVDVGTKAPLEMVQSESGVARREEDIIRRLQAVGDAEDQLRRHINFARGRLWEVPILPVTGPEIDHQPINVPDAVELAYKKRPDVARQRLNNETRQLDARVAKNALLPSLDLVAGYGFNGGPGTDEIGNTGYGDGIDTVLDGEFESWSVRLNFSMPLENREAKARLARAKLFVKQGDFELEDLKGLVRLEVRRAARAVESAAKSIESAKVSRHFAEKNLDAERKRYENGLSTSFQVLEIQEQLSEARSSEVAAIIGYRQALTTFEQATGSLLDRYGIELVEEEE